MTRDNSIDVAKSIGIILVVAAHAGFGITTYSSLFYMQLFIFLSGYVFKEKYTLKELLKKKIKSLYIPFLIYEFIFLAFHNILYCMQINEEKFNLLNYVSSSIHILLFDNIEILLSPIWFLTVIFLITIAFKVILIVKEKLNLWEYSPIIICILLLPIGIFFTKNNINIDWSYNLKEMFNITLTSLIFFAIGFYIKKIGKIKFSNIIIFTVSVIAIFASVQFGYKVDTRINFYSNSYLLVPIAFAGIYITMCISKILEKIPKINQIFSYIGKNTIPILALHIIVFKLIAMAQVYIFNYYPVEKLTGWRILYYNGKWQCLLLILGVLLPLLINYIVHIIRKKSKEGFSFLQQRICHLLHDKSK